VTGPHSKVATPIVVDLGKVGHEDIEQLREGDGRLRDDAEEVMRLVRAKVERTGGNRVTLAIVAVYTERSSS
jgi:hypothetical protein